MSGVDSSAATGLRELHDGLLARNVSLEIARATDSLETAMDRLGLVELIGTDHIHGTVISPVESAARPDPTDHGPTSSPDALGREDRRSSIGLYWNEREAAVRGLPFDVRGRLRTEFEPVVA